MTTPEVPPAQTPPTPQEQVPAPSPYGWYPPPTQAPVPPPYGWYPPMNTYAILSLIFAIAVFPPLGIYFGNKAKRQIAERGERGIELARAGVICGWIFSTIQGLFLIVWCGFGVALIAGGIAGGAGPGSGG